MKSISKKLTLIFIIILTFSIFAFGQIEREEGIELYNQKNYEAATVVFKKLSKANKKDAVIWNYLGLSYFNRDKYKDARKAFAKAIKLEPQTSSYRVNLAYAYLYSNKRSKAKNELERAIKADFKSTNAYFLRGTINQWEGKYDDAISDAERIIALDRNYSIAYLLKVNALLSNFGKKWREESEPKNNLNILQTAVETLESCQEDCRKGEIAESFESKMAIVKGFSDYFNGKKEYDKDLSNQTPLKILYKPEASYSESARQAGYQGSTTLAVLFAADGKTKYIIAINTLDHGLTEQAIKAASLITFEPEIIDGKPISVVKRIQYSFTIY